MNSTPQLSTLDNEPDLVTALLARAYALILSWPEPETETAPTGDFGEQTVEAAEPTSPIELGGI